MQLHEACAIQMKILPHAAYSIYQREHSLVFSSRKAREEHGIFAWTIRIHASLIVICLIIISYSSVHHRQRHVGTAGKSLTTVSESKKANNRPVQEPYSLPHLGLKHWHCA